MLIVFEGLEGAGKKTQADLCVKYLRSKGKKVKTYSYPDKKGVHRRVVDAFLKDNVYLGPTSQLLTFLADIAKDQKKIIEDIGKGSVVITDRYVFSSIAYQDVPIERSCGVIKDLRFVRPDVVFYMDASPEVVSMRMKKERKKMGRFSTNKEHLLLARIKYQTLADKNFLCPWITIDSNKEIHEIAKGVKSFLAKKL